ncbi:outer dense fiber protein 2-like [Styela clava]
MAASPIHVHVQDNTPVHVHVKKPKSAVINRHQPDKLIADLPSSSHRPQKPTAKSRSKAINGPWIPAPGRTSLRDKTNQGFKWDNGRSQLEVNLPSSREAQDANSALKVGDLSLHDEDDVRSHIMNYEKKIEDLMKEVGTLRNEVELKKIEHEIEDRDEQLEASRAALERQQKELDLVQKEYQETEKENNRLRKSVERIKDDLGRSLDISELGSSKDELLKKLIEVELDGASCEKQIVTLRNVVKRLCHDNRISPSNLAVLNKERDLLVQKLEEFEASNTALRSLLQTHHEVTAGVKRSEEDRNTMIRKVAESDSTALRFKSELAYLKNELDQVLSQLSEEKNHSRTLTELNKSIDATRAHLQRELRAKEMENNRLQVQLRNMERDTTIAQKEAEDITAAARFSQETITAEKEALKKATRAQRQRADQADQILRETETRLAEKQNQLSKAHEECETWKSRYHRAMDDRARSDNQVKSLTEKLDESEAMLRRNENKSRDRDAELTEKLHKLSSDNGSNQLECERLKAELRTTGEKLKLALEDAAGQRNQVQQYETLNSELRAGLAKSKNEAEEALLSAERAEREARRMREQGSDEIERVRKQMLQRMKDLQPLPELLKETEMKLQDAQDQIHTFERRSAEQTRIISELTSKDEMQSDDVDSLRQNIATLKDENRALMARLDIVNTNLNDRDNVLRESAIDRADKDENIQTLQLKLEEKNYLCSSLQQQLDSALEEIRKTAKMERDKATAREKASEARICDLETQITCLKTDVASVKRSKLDTERRLQSQIQDARDRLEQSESTNRSMRNYVNFLKSSYSTVFGADAVMTSSPAKSGPGMSSPRSPY